MKEATSALHASAAAPAAPISRLRWGIILILLIAAVVNYLDRANLSIANTTIAREFGFSSTEMACCCRRFCGHTRLPTCPPAGWWTSWGRRKCFPGRWGCGRHLP